MGLGFAIFWLPLPYQILIALKSLIMKKIFLFLLLLTASVGAFAQSENDITDKGYVSRNGSGFSNHYESIEGVLFVIYQYYYDTEPSPYILVKFPQDKNVTTYTVPDKTSIIAKGAFQGNKYIQTIRIPSSVYYIGDNAFEDCANLKSIEVYNSSSSIKTVEEDRDVEKTELGRYNINGVKVEETDDGVQIILYSDGTADKVLKP